MSREQENKSSNSKNQKIWNDVKSDLVAEVISFPQCMTFGDVMNEGESKLICGDVFSKLKLLKLECLVMENKAQSTPVALECFKGFDSKTKVIYEYLAVAGAQFIYIYKNMKGSFKLVIPNIEINSLEQQIWTDLQNSKIDNQGAVQKLRDLANESKEAF